MNTVCREQFIALQSQDILGNLSDQFQRNYCSADHVHLAKNSSQKGLYELRGIRAQLLFESIPNKGSLDLGVVQDSIYFFN